MQTGENEQGLRKIIDLTRMISIAILLLHFYFYCYKAFVSWGWTSTISDRILTNLQTGLFKDFNLSKIVALGLLFILLIGARGKKDEKLNARNTIFWLMSGLSIFFGIILLFKINAPIETIAITYMLITTVGFLIILSSGTMLSRLIKLRSAKDIFNHLNESFPQEERYLLNEYSINLPACYRLKEKIKKSWINIINLFRGLLVIGSPGSGKSWFVIQHVIKQHIEKGFTMFIYDFKYDDLSKIAYNWLQLHKNKYAVPPSFYVINFDNLSVSHRCNH